MGAYQFGKKGRRNISDLLKTAWVRVVNPRPKTAHKIGLFLAALFLFSFVAASYVPKVKGDISAERSFSSTASDAQLSYLSSNFSEAWGATAATWLDNAGQLMVGGLEFGSAFNVARVALYFPTSNIPDGATITGAVLSLYVQQDNSTNDFNVTIQGTGTYPHDPATTTDFYRGWYGSTVLGSRATNDSLSAGAYWNITLNNAGLALISKTGTTKFLIRSSEDIAGIQPTDQEYLMIAARDKGESYAAKLIVTYSVSGGSDFNYYFVGPYEDNGKVYNGTAHITLTPNFNSTFEFDLTADGTTPSNYAVALEQRAISISWNISSSGNLTRVHYFTKDNTETVYVCIPDHDLPFYLYGFQIDDFVGVTNGYLESTLYINGATRVVERQPINTINAVPFYMTWAKVYGMRVVADQGVVTVGSFTALSETNPTVIIPSGAFPQAFQGLAVSVGASRVNSSRIQVNYFDSENGTHWIRVYIIHRLTTGEYMTDYYEESATNSYQLNWDGACPKTDYVVQVQSYRRDQSGNESVKDWSFYAPYVHNQTNIWEPLNQLGDGLPFRMEYLPAVILIFAAILAFSFWHISAAAWIGWTMAVVCTLFGWLPFNFTGSTMTLGIGAVICAGITIGEFKKGERTV